jgi:hypothetical protein
MEEQGLILEEATFKFSQDPNCLDNRDEYEYLEVRAQSSLGIDRDGDCFFTLSTEKWSVDSAAELQQIFDRILGLIKPEYKKL